MKTTKTNRFSTNIHADSSRLQEPPQRTNLDPLRLFFGSDGIPGFSYGGVAIYLILADAGFQREFGSTTTSQVRQTKSPTPRSLTTTIGPPQTDLHGIHNKQRQTKTPCWPRVVSMHLCLQ